MSWLGRALAQLAAIGEPWWDGGDEPLDTPAPHKITPAHDVHETKHYEIHYPAHEPRSGDPFYKEFEAFKRRTKATAKCSFGESRNDFSDCAGPLAVHHSHIEFALQNSVDIKMLELAFPDITDPTKIGEWVESDKNLIYLCQYHHIGAGGVHVVSSSDYEASHYIRHLFALKAAREGSSVEETVKPGDDDDYRAGPDDSGTR